MAWTPDQQAAIDSRGQTLLLSAAAGSGKTAVLVERIIRRLLDRTHPLDITELLVVTFTKAAAAEMRERIGTALTQVLAETGGADAERQLALLPSAHISTLHSFCQDVIRRYFYTIDMDPSVTIAGEEELRLLRRSVLEDVFLSYYEAEDKAPVLYPLVDMFGSDHGDDVLMDTVSRVYDYSRSMPWPDQWLKQAAAAYAVPDGAAIDDMPWCSPVKDQIHRSVEELLRRYETVLHDMAGRTPFAAARESFAVEADGLRTILQQKDWDDMAQAVCAVEFPRLKGLRGLSEEDKAFWERCKDMRTAVKKELTESIQQPYFSLAGSEWLDGMRAMKPVMDGLVRLTGDFAAAYSAAKREKGWMDFSDLEHFCLRILLGPDSTPSHPVPSAAAEELRREYAEILIDEYQDTNGVQELITTLVSREHNRFMVGDIKQSIYRFRLADPTLFMKKYASFSRQKDAAQRCIDLSKNFRSAPVVLDAVNAVFSRAMTSDAAGMAYGEREQLYAGRDNPSDPRWVGGPVEVHVVHTGKDDGPVSGEEIEAQEQTAFQQECQVIARQIQELKGSGQTVARKDGTMEPLTYRHIVVLLRSMAGKASDLLQILQAAGIPAYAEQSGGYFAAMEVQCLLALLQCIDNPEQDLPMAAVLRSPVVGLSDASLAELRLSGDQSLWRNLPDYAALLPAGEEKEGLCQFIQNLQHWRTYSRRHGVAELLQELYRQTGYYDYVGAMPGGAVRQANLQALYDRARQYEESGFRGLFRYLRLIDKMKEDGVDLAPAKVLSEREDVVRVMSIHKSKGLEFPVVIVADMGKSFNRQDMQSLILFHNVLGIGIKQYDPVWRMSWPTLAWNGISAQLSWESTAEEERILYVAMTRARDKLILTGHSSFLNRDWQRWRSGISPARGRSYFDWVLPLLTAGHDDVSAVTESHPAEWDCGLWHVVVERAPSVLTGGVSAEAQQAEPRLDCLRRGVPTGTPVPAWLDEALSWQYAWPQAVQTPAKLSVTEIKRQYNLSHGAEDVETDSLAASVVPSASAGGEDDDAFAQLPPWLAGEQEAATGAQRGTATHKVMQYLDIAAAGTEEGVQHQLAQWEKDGLFTADEVHLVRIPAVVQFCQSPLGQRMAAAAEMHREYPFSVLLPGGGYLPDVEDGEGLLVQGVIDCLFRDDNGWVLVDYKTDRLQTADAFRTRYAVQLALYRQALEQLGVPVSQSYIYSFYLHQTIAV
ncbi:helicase-exonuclease AddAB subunit AddA [uncultured Megasphaera sp.]|uniref:helicase-exonuclease AddAB subunit AddA n=1 Tax=uncultured Megasphaera sp. TaxID=165188 RepID=UPI00265B05F8|nr:helicase-exonuclease AddAB subunit AddA [uncultured Megasphaera sp.]